MKGRRLWLRVAVHGGMMPVYVVKGELLVDGVLVDAYFDSETPCVVISHTENVAMMKQRLHHELLHVLFAAHSGDILDSVLGSKSIHHRAKREEVIVSFIEPIQFDLLVRNKWLRYPNPPRM